MIEFNGEIYGDCKKFLLKKQRNIQLIGIGITSAIYSIPIVLAAIFWKPIAACFLLPFLCAFCVLGKPANKKEQAIFVPMRIYLDLEENTIVHECKKMERFHVLDSVETVIDYGEWYYFVFKFEDRDPYFICQKSLLTQGTIEEFEALFEGKIQRKTFK